MSKAITNSVARRRDRHASKVGDRAKLEQRSEQASSVKRRRPVLPTRSASRRSGKQSEAQETAGSLVPGTEIPIPSAPTAGNNQPRATGRRPCLAEMSVRSAKLRVMPKCQPSSLNAKLKIDQRARLVRDGRKVPSIRCT